MSAKITSGDSSSVIISNRVNATPHDHQTRAVMWGAQLEEKEKHGGIFWLEPGLGKSLIAVWLSLLRGGFTLIVTPKSGLGEWKDNCFEKFSSEDDPLRVMYLHKNHTDPSTLTSSKSMRRHDFVVTTYDVVTTMYKKRMEENEKIGGGDDVFNPIFDVAWDRVIADESHRFANKTTKVFTAMDCIPAKFKWCLSGTVVRNKEEDKFNQLEFCGFTRGDSDSWILFMDYKIAGQVMPVKTKMVTFVELNTHEKILYERILSRAKSAYEDATKNLCSYTKVASRFIKLRQAAIAPCLILPQSKRKSTKFISPEGIVEDVEKMYASSKLMEIVDKARRITVERGEKMLLFSAFTSVLDLLESGIKNELPGVGVMKMDGGVTSTVERGEIVRRFREDDKMKILLMTYKVGGEILTLTQARHVLRIDMWWNESVHDQSDNRTWRLGQDKEVFIHTIIVRGTVEERMLQVCQRKNAISHSCKKVSLSLKMIGEMISH